MREQTRLDALVLIYEERVGLYARSRLVGYTATEQ